MAGPIQVGDLIKFTELAWEVWNYGWADEHNAGENYRAFGTEVDCLRANLEGLETAVMNAQKLLEQHGARQSDSLSGGKEAISEVIGDYNATLEECKQLLATNRRYAGTTGPVRNIDWNMSLMPQVNSLRSRIQMHNIRIQTVLKPFEIDLVRNLHADLVQRLDGLQSGVNLVQWTVQSLIARSYPELAEEIEQQLRQQIHVIEIPASLYSSLEAKLNDRPEAVEGSVASLQELTDCLLVHFDKSTVQLRHQGRRTYPSLDQYIELVKCQFLMNRIKSFDEACDSNEISHWPGYVRALQEKLSNECMRFQSELLAPQVAGCDHTLLDFWPKTGDQSVATHFDIGPDYDMLMELPLSTGSERIEWKTMRLSRQVGSRHRFRIIERWKHYGHTVNDERVVNFNLHRASFIPSYADPSGEDRTSPPLEVLIVENDIVYAFVFLDIKDLFQFQQAITGYEVAANYLGSNIKAVFVRPGEGGNATEKATIQLWIPTKFEEKIETTTGHVRAPSISSASISTAFKIPRRASSNFSGRSTAIASSPSWSSNDSVKSDGQSGSTINGLIRSRPGKPLLVLFTKNLSTSEYAIVAISIDNDTKPNPQRCECHRLGDCPITAIEQGSGAPSTMSARRLDCRSNKWDLLPLTSKSSAAPTWRGLVRVSLLFGTSEARYRFGGGPCRCVPVTNDQLAECITSRHQGLLGVLREHHRREMIVWQEHRDNQRDVREQLGRFR